VTILLNCTVFTQHICKQILDQFSRHQGFALRLRTAAYHRDIVTFLCLIPDKGSCKPLADFVVTKAVTSVS